jgi:hypothetical protein
MKIGNRKIDVQEKDRARPVFEIGISYGDRKANDFEICCRISLTTAP